MPGIRKSLVFSKKMKSFVNRKFIKMITLWIFMSTPKCWLLGWWYPRGRNVNQQCHRSSDVNSYQPNKWRRLEKKLLIMVCFGMMERRKNGITYKGKIMWHWPLRCGTIQIHCLVRSIWNIFARFQHFYFYHNVACFSWFWCIHDALDGNVKVVSFKYMFVN